MTFKDLLEQPIEGVQTALSVISAIEGDGAVGAAGPTKLLIEQRRLLPEEPRPPKRAESLARGHVFYEIDGFIEYLKKYGGEKTVIFADPQAGIVQATLDETAANGREVLMFKPMLHPQWKPWDELIEESKITLQQFLEHCSNNRRGISSPNPRDLVLMFSQVNACSKVEVMQGQGKNSINGVVIKTEIKGAENSTFEELPDTLVLDLPIYVGTQPATIEIDITLSARPGEGVNVTLAAGDLLEAKYRIFASMFMKFKELDKATVTMGTVSQHDWRYLPEPKIEPTIVQTLPAREAHYNSR